MALFIAIIVYDLTQVCLNLFVFLDGSDINTGSQNSDISIKKLALETME